MSKKTKQNRAFGTFDLVAMIALGSAVLVICGTIVQEMLQDDRPDRARMGAEAIAHQMVAGGFAEAVAGVSDAKPEAIAEHGSRGPASLGSAAIDNAPTLNLVEGSLGKDPWGRPYRYKLLRSNEGNAVRILVWSEGPNEVSDTEFMEVDVALSAPKEKIKFGGDDVGFVY